MEWRPIWGFGGYGDDDEESSSPFLPDSSAAPAPVASSEFDAEGEAPAGPPKPRWNRYDPMPNSRLFNLPAVRMQKTTDQDSNLTCSRAGCTREAWMKSVGLKVELRHCNSGKHNAAVTRQFLNQVAEEGKLRDLKTQRD